MDKTKILKDIYKTLKKCIEIKAYPIKDPKKTLSFKKSKFAGLPYFPEGMIYPRNTKGEPLHLLAQINCREIPRLDLFPGDGFLQFYIDTDDSFGLNFNKSNANSFKVLYIPSSFNNKKQSDLSFLQKPKNFPVAHEHRLEFFERKKPISTSNPEFYDVFCEYIEENENSSDADFYDLYSAVINESNSHQISGYPSFIQEVPGDLDKDHHFLLLQIGYDKCISFGDAGIANFFIKKNDLINRDFSNILYHWDCF